jgi:hypothetical protein
MMCKATTGYTGDMEMYTAEDKELGETIFSVLEPYLDLWHHVYQDNHYNSVQTTEKLFLWKTKFCGTIRANRGIPKPLADFSEKLKWTILCVVSKGTYFYASRRIRGRFA